MALAAMPNWIQPWPKRSCKMLWRAKYSTWEPHAATMPPLEGIALDESPFKASGRFVVLGGFDLRAQAEIGVWKRLLAEAQPGVRIWTVYLLESGRASKLTMVQSMTSKSEWPTTVVAESTALWRELIQADRPERSFAGLVSGVVIDPLMIGVPTEEAWDRFRDSLSC